VALHLEGVFAKDSLASLFVSHHISIYCPQYGTKFTYHWKEAALGGFAAGSTSRLEVRDVVRDGRGCK